jgi:hypothetical protein
MKSGVRSITIKSVKKKDEHGAVFEITMGWE